MQAPMLEEALYRWIITSQNLPKLTLEFVVEKAKALAAADRDGILKACFTRPCPYPCQGERFDTQLCRIDTRLFFFAAGPGRLQVL
jgi:hypothetical protein